ncbi:flavin reductase family protein [Flammeovirga agarivorans]|uniref:Flavin reductase family protein n=1 Tax=Flammeovirga agarivorans TaxID=2726742 RepID=A0A7X8XX23_9BACT|nr:flavin reductase family protein [Flammeovirga agarivorans]NLR92836.1 flavin reductase family protein [Flammeovirga agarivorans]
MKTYTPSELSTAQMHNYLLSAVAPRPIAFVSTVDGNGNVNLSPYSCFNFFGAKPPILVFSPTRRVRDNTIKHTLENILETKECVVNIVPFTIVEQMSLSSTEYDKGVNEFTKAGLTEVPSKEVKAPRVMESPVQFECKLQQVIEMGQEGGAGNLVICEVVRIHLDEDILDTKGMIDNTAMDLMGRMGGHYYVRASGDALMTIQKPIRQKGIGIDKLPLHIVESDVLTGNQLAKLANVEAIPSEEVLNSIEVPQMSSRENNHMLASKLLNKGRIIEAWKVLLS